MACEKRGGVLASKTRERTKPGADGGSWAPLSIATSAPAAWLGSPVPFPTAYVKEVRMAAFPLVMVFVYLLCGWFVVFFLAGTGRSGLLVSFLSSLSECALTQPRAACVRACPPLVSQLSCHREDAQLLLGWCLLQQSTALCRVSPAPVPSFPPQTVTVPSNGSLGTVFQLSMPDISPLLLTSSF